MPGMGLVAPVRDGVAWGSVTRWGAAGLVVFLCYWAILSDGAFHRAGPLVYGLTFNSMIEHLARGAFDVDPEVIAREAFLRDGRTYAYWGIFPALMRAPILVVPGWRGIDFTVVACACGATVAALGQVATLRAVRPLMGEGTAARLVAWLGVAAVVACGPQVQFLRPSIYQEAIFWASAQASLFVFLAVRWCIDPAKRRTVHMVLMALLAALCLNTRVSTSVGLYAACGGLLLAGLAVMVRRRGWAAAVGPVLRQAAGPAAVLAVGILVCGFVNYMRWGSPLVFQDLRAHVAVAPGDPVHEMIALHGHFGVARVPFALGYYFLPVWVLYGDDGHFLFRAVQDRLYYAVEFPPASFLLSDPFLLVLAGLGAWGLARRAPAWVDALAARAIAAGLVLPGLLMLAAITVAFRYRMEFYPLFLFLGAFGQVALVALIGRGGAWRAGCMVAVGTGVAASCVFLLGYKITPWGDSAPIEAMGWCEAIRSYFEEKYPGAAMRLRRMVPGLS